MYRAVYCGLKYEIRWTDLFGIVTLTRSKLMLLCGILNFVLQLDDVDQNDTSDVQLGSSFIMPEPVIVTIASV
jgi:hypothetical protein